MKRLAPLFALLWCGQIPLCLLAAEASHAHGSAEAVATGEPHQHHQAGHGAATPGAPEGEGVPSDPSCAEHCAALAQAVPVQTASSAGLPVVFLALPLGAAAMAPALPYLWRPAGALGPPPPEPPHRTSVLRL